MMHFAVHNEGFMCIQIDYVSWFPIWVDYRKYHKYSWLSEVNTHTCRVCQAQESLVLARHEYHS